MTNEELEARCRETDADEDYAVYGDWLEERGDPRGKLIAMQLAGLDPGDLLVELGPPPYVDVTWRAGFWHAIRVRAYAVDLAAVLAHDSARLVREVTLDPHPLADFDVAVLERGRSLDLPSWTALTRVVWRDGDGDGTAWRTALPALQRLQLGPRSLIVNDTELDEPWARTIASVAGLSELHLGSPIARASTTSRDVLLALAPLADSLVTFAATTYRELDDVVCASLATFTRLEVLVIPRAELTGAGLAELARLPRLRHLDVFGCPHLDDACGAIIGTFPAIETVTIQDTPMTAQGVKGIARSRTIQKIILDAEQYPEDIEHVLGIELADS